eukprot:GAHX01001630.1.p1 GENE.GAHX01001630.1~~GAHX01001630.1.p1  ORF type:complete len:177 (-),score=42.49 GAHX01001630.1:41-571(-)
MGKTNNKQYKKIEFDYFTEILMKNTMAFLGAIHKQKISFDGGRTEVLEVIKSIYYAYQIKLGLAFEKSVNDFFMKHYNYLGLNIEDWGEFLYSKKEFTMKEENENMIKENYNLIEEKTEIKNTNEEIIIEEINENGQQILISTYGCYIFDDETRIRLGDNMVRIKDLFVISEMNGE